MSDNRTINEEYAAIGAELIENEPELAYIRDVDARIIYLSSDCRKKDGMKVIFGQCEKIADKYKWGLPCDFTVTIFEPNVVEFSEEQMRILIFHELLHVGTDGKSVRPHDLEDFKVIINRFGTEWNVV